MKCCKGGIVILEEFVILRFVVGKGFEKYWLDMVCFLIYFYLLYVIKFLFLINFILSRND